MVVLTRTVSNSQRKVDEAAKTKALHTETLTAANKHWDQACEISGHTASQLPSQSASHQTVVCGATTDALSPTLSWQLHEDLELAIGRLEGVAEYKLYAGATLPPHCGSHHSPWYLR